MANYVKIYTCDIVNGEGLRTSIFFSGCPHHCKGCFNQEAWDKNIGKPFTDDTIDTIIKLIDNEHIDGISILGGEPLAPYNIDVVLRLCEIIYSTFPEKTIWLWTGYKIEDFNEKQKKILEFIDVLIDGPFIEELKDMNLEWRGSTNQRILKRENSFLTIERGK